MKDFIKIILPQVKAAIMAALPAAAASCLSPELCDDELLNENGSGLHAEMPEEAMPVCSQKLGSASCVHAPENKSSAMSTQFALRSLGPLASVHGHGHRGYHPSYPDLQFKE